MIRKTFFLLLSACVACCAQQAGSTDAAFHRYSVINEKNIYLKKKQSPVSGELLNGQVKSILREKPVPVEMRVLTGVVDNGAEYIAFFEDMSLRRTYRVRKGDTVLNKLVESINIDGVFYTENGSRNTVRIGQSITGLSASAAVETSAAPVTMSYEKPVAVEIVDSSAIRIIDKPDEKTLLERLRLRRQREMQ